MNGWYHTFVIILSVITTTVGSVMWLQNRLHQMETRLILGEVEREAMRLRVIEYGFSKLDAQKFIDDLRQQADHPVPRLGN